MKLKVVDATDRKAVYRNHRRRYLPPIVAKERGKSAVFSQRKEMLMLVLERRELKPRSEGIEGHRLKTLGESLH
jgi:hypothetical protein